MKINDPLTGAPSVRSQKARNPKDRRSSTSVTINSSQDSVEITQTSAHLNMLDDKLSQMDTSEASKLEAIKQAVAEGRFQVDEEAVADALIQNGMELMKRQGRK